MNLSMLISTAKSFFSLPLKQKSKFAGMAFSHPIFFVLTILSTALAYQKAKKEYPTSSSNDGQGNAFRHSYWCCLILMYCSKVSSAHKAGKWCKEFTNLHEELFPNSHLAKTMDLHNNQVGMRYFFSQLPYVHRQFFERSFFLEALHQKTKNSVVLHSETQVLDPDTLVYLEKR